MTAIFGGGTAAAFGRTSDGVDTQVLVAPDSATSTEVLRNNANAQNYYLTAIGTQGTNDNDVVYTSADVTPYGSHSIECTVGVVDIQVTLDGTNWNTTQAAVLLHDDVTTGGGIKVLTIAAGKIGLLTGKFKNIRVLQNGAVASNCRVFHGVE